MFDRLLGRLIEECESFGFTVYFGQTKAKENAEVRKVLAPLVKLAEETGVLVLVNSHLNKGAGKALYRVLDSIAFIAVGRTVHLVIRDAENPDNVKIHLRQNQCRIETIGADLPHSEALDSDQARRGNRDLPYLLGHPGH